jgi:hypothetical protein
MLIWSIDKNIASMEKVIYSIFVISYMGLVYDATMLDENLWKMISASTIIFNIASRVPQIW